MTPLPGDVAVRARAWHRGWHSAFCDVLEPWAHGTIVRATRYPSYFDLNVVRVEDDPGMSVGELVAFAEEALSGLSHRRLNFDLVEIAEALRDGFEARGWKAFRLLWMRYEASPPPGPALAVEEVSYDAVRDLRVAWHREDFPDRNPAAYLAQSREVSLRRGAQVLAVREGRALVAFAQLERKSAAAEITQVYVRPEYRGAGRGTALTRAAIEAAGDVRDLWIAADDEDHAKNLYARLGFRAAWTTMDYTLLP